MLKHYKDGEFHKDYDRLETLQSVVNFMRDPTGDIPWEEDSTAVDVVHIPDALVSSWQEVAEWLQWSVTGTKNHIHVLVR